MARRPSFGLSKIAMNAPAQPRQTPLSPFLRMGAVVALVTALADQGVKYWLLEIFNIATKGAVRVTPFFDLVLAWNTGISYGWFQNTGEGAQIALLVVKALAVGAFGYWLARAETRLTALGLGLIIGGAIGNAIDRIAHGAVVDYALLHAEIGGRAYNWYVFNLADVAIVAGVIALLYDSLIGAKAPKAP